jgi:hypothetical protein
MIEYDIKHPDVRMDHLGLIPLFLYPAAPRPAREQFAERYAHGGGWKPMQGFDVLEGAIQYPGDPHPRLLLAEGRLGEETIRIYDGAWVAIVQPDGATEIGRMD